MGRIVIFTVRACRDTPRIESVLRSLGIPYDLINLSDHPEKRRDLLSLCDRINVPQVFVHEAYVGGFEDSLAFLQTWSLERFQQQIACMPDTDDERLRVPKSTSDIPRPHVARQTPSIYGRSANYSISLPDGSDLSVGQIMKRLRSELPLMTRRYKLTEYHNSCLGSDVVSCVQRIFVGCKEEAEAIAFAQQLQQRKILHHVCDDVHPIDSTKNSFFYRLQCHHTPFILNKFFEVVPTNNKYHKTRSVHDLSRSLMNQLNAMESDLTEIDLDGRVMVDYNGILNHHAFTRFEEALCELQFIDLGALEENHRLAFGINIYNLMLRYGFIKLGFPDSSEKRQMFLSSVKIQIGNDLLSFQDLEYGVLRGNQKPHHFSSVAPFSGSKNDTRLRLALKGTDARVHFALHDDGGVLDDNSTFNPLLSFSKCNPVESFSPSKLEEELQLAAQAFCERDENLRLDCRNNKVYLAHSLEIFAKDLRLNNSQLLSRLLDYTRGDKRRILQAMLQRKPKVQFRPYAWKPADAESFRVFDAIALKSNVKRLKKLMKNKETRSSISSMESTVASFQSISKSSLISSSSSRSRD